MCGDLRKDRPSQSHPCFRKPWIERMDRGLERIQPKLKRAARSATLLFSLVGEAGIEPTTPGLEGRCSIRLSYSPALSSLL